MENSTQARNERLALLIGGPGAIVIFAIGWWAIARLAPPPAPTRSGQYLAAYFHEHSTRITIGLIVATLGGTLMALWVVVITLQMRRIEGRLGVLSLSQLILGGVITIEFLTPGVILLEPAFRTNLPAGTVLGIFDLGMLFFIQPSYTVIPEAIIFGIAILQDRHDPPIFPRWSGYLNLFFGFSFVLFLIEPFFKHGVMAWNGAVGWWVALGLFAVWVLVETAVVFKGMAPSRTATVAGGVGDHNGADPDWPREVELLRAEVAALRRELTVSPS